MRSRPLDVHHLLCAVLLGACQAEQPPSPPSENDRTITVVTLNENGEPDVEVMPVPRSPEEVDTHTCPAPSMSIELHDVLTPPNVLCLLGTGVAKLSTLPRGPVFTWQNAIFKYKSKVQNGSFILELSGGGLQYVPYTDTGGAFVPANALIKQADRIELLHTADMF